jgi:hypothetical protein
MVEKAPTEIIEILLNNKPTLLHEIHVKTIRTR